MTERLRELLAAATPGPWSLEKDGERISSPGGTTVVYTIELADVTHDAALIVEAVNALPELLDAHDRMAGALRRIVEAAEAMSDSHAPEQPPGDYITVLREALDQVPAEFRR